jgi:hypothetical protein
MQSLTLCVVFQALPYTLIASRETARHHRVKVAARNWFVIDSSGLGRRRALNKAFPR